MKTILNLTTKNLKELRREPAALFFMLVFPLAESDAWWVGDVFWGVGVFSQ